MPTQPSEIVNTFTDPRNPEEEEEITPVGIVLANLDIRIESAQEDFLRHARWAQRDLDRIVQDAEKGRFGEFHGDSRSIRSMAEAALTIRLLAEARSSVLWAIDRAREADDAREGE
jgi:hypothetical protein